jgi:uncharacterized membrane protein YkvA (DUF1232 family)
MPIQESDFYTSLRNRIESWLTTDEGRGSQWTDYLLAAPDLLHLLAKLSMDPDVPVKEKAKVGAVLAYFVSPIDIVPEALGGPPGLLEDIALAAFVLKGIVSNTNPEVVQRHWAGDRNVLELIQNVVERADAMLGAVTWRRVRKLVSET